MTPVSTPTGETTTPIDSTPYGGTIPPVSTTAPPATTSTVVERPQQPTNSLAFTGGDVVGVGVLGGLALIVGALLTVASRRRRQAPLA